MEYEILINQEQVQTLRKTGLAISIVSILGLVLFPCLICGKTTEGFPLKDVLDWAYILIIPIVAGLAWVLVVPSHRGKLVGGTALVMVPSLLYGALFAPDVIFAFTGISRRWGARLAPLPLYLLILERCRRSLPFGLLGSIHLHFEAMLTLLKDKSLLLVHIPAWPSAWAAAVFLMFMMFTVLLPLSVLSFFYLIEQATCCIKGASSAWVALAILLSLNAAQIITAPLILVCGLTIVCGLLLAIEGALVYVNWRYRVQRVASLEILSRFSYNSGSRASGGVSDFGPNLFFPFISTASSEAATSGSSRFLMTRGLTREELRRIPLLKVYGEREKSNSAQSTSETIDGALSTEDSNRLCGAPEDPSSSYQTQEISNRSEPSTASTEATNTQIAGFGDTTQRELRHCPNDLEKDTNLVCTICQDVLTPGSMASVLPKCHHSFHPDCVLRWLKRRPLCPNCNLNVRLTLPPASNRSLGGLEHNDGGVSNSYSSIAGPSSGQGSVAMRFFALVSIPGLAFVPYGLHNPPPIALSDRQPNVSTRRRNLLRSPVRAALMLFRRGREERLRGHYHITVENDGGDQSSWSSALLEHNVDCESQQQQDGTNQNPSVCAIVASQRQDSCDILRNDEIETHYQEMNTLQSVENAETVSNDCAADSGVVVQCTRAEG